MVSQIPQITKVTYLAEDLPESERQRSPDILDRLPSLGITPENHE